MARWAARWNLDGPGLEWLRAEALQAARKGFVGAPAIADFVLTHDLELSLSWEPAESGETRAQFLARARRELEAYADEVQDWARENAPSARRAERTTGQAEAGAARWDLLVSRLVLGSTFQAIGEEIGISWQGAREHVRRLAARLGVALP
ncbi:MAG: hypothetical protein HZB56_07855 [Deltaproteobacteria bacterium]|nr:hypothetical protein [Deltaproteobacteria bacterium]